MRNAGRLLGFAVLALAPVDALATERIERTLEDKGPIAAGSRVQVDNLLGSITLEGGRGADRAPVTARVVVEAGTRQEALRLADSIRIVRGSDASGTFVRVAYPEDAPAFRLPKSEAAGPISRWILPLFQREVRSVTYAGRDVRLGPEKTAVAVAVHLTVRLPHGVQASARQIAGAVRCLRLRGTLQLEADRGELFASQVHGSLRARTEGGDIVLKTFKGEQLDLASSAGDLDLVDVASRQARLRTAGGRIRGRLVNSSALGIETEGGDVRLEELESVKLDVKTGSGLILLTSRLRRTRDVSIESRTGDVFVQVSDLAPFDLSATTKSGSVETRGLSRIERLEEGAAETRLRRSTGGASLRIYAPGGKVMLAAL